MREPANRYPPRHWQVQGMPMPFCCPPRAFAFFRDIIDGEAKAMLDWLGIRHEQPCLVCDGGCYVMLSIKSLRLAILQLVIWGAEARCAVAQAQAAGALLDVHENFRFQLWYRCMAKAINSGLVGNVQQFVFRLCPGDGQGHDAYLERQPYFCDMPRLLIHEAGVHFVKAIPVP